MIIQPIKIALSLKELLKLLKSVGWNVYKLRLRGLLQKGPVVAPIIGATKESHLTNAIPALDLILTEEEVQFLEEPYIPHVIVGHK